MTTSVDFGVILIINGKDVPIEPAKAVRNAKVDGMEFSLPQRVEIGTAAELGAFLGTLTDDLPHLPQSSDFPTPLDQVYGKLTSLNLAVEKLDLRVPPSTPAKPTTFTLGLSATWSDGSEVNLISGKLAIKGLYVRMIKT